MEGFILLAIIVWIIYICAKSKKQTPAEFQQQQSLNQNMICPHCNTKGSVTTKKVKRKQGISGGKAVAAIFTCGISMIGTGLSRKNTVTEASCTNCNSIWYY